MAQSFVEALKNAKIIPEGACRDILAQKGQKEQMQIGEKKKHLLSKSNQPVSLDRLQTATTARECMSAIKNLLLEFPDNAGEFFPEINQAIHRFKDEPGGKHLIGITLRVREHLPRIKPEFRKDFFRRAFRKAGTNLKIPPEWLI